MDESDIYYGEISMGPVKQEPVQSGHLHLDENRLTGRLEAKLVARQPVHVGSGMLLPPEELGLKADFPLIKAFFRSGKRLLIPGTSLKGAIRSLVEIYTASCAPGTRGERACVFNINAGRISLCPACRIFGALGYQGAVHFSDGIFLKGTRHKVIEIPPQYEPRQHAGMRRYYPHDRVDQRPQTWPLEVISPGSSFRLQASFENLLPGELGLILIALGQGKWEICPKIGAAKSAGFGAVEVHNLQVDILDVQDAYTRFQTNWKAVDVKTCLEAAGPLIRMQALEQLAEDLSGDIIPGDET